MRSHPGIETSLSPTPPEEILITDFFGGVANVEVLPAFAELEDREMPLEASAQPLGGSAVSDEPPIDKRPETLKKHEWLGRGLASESSTRMPWLQDIAAWLFPLGLAIYASSWAFKVKSDKLE